MYDPRLEKALSIIPSDRETDEVNELFLELDAYYQALDQSAIIAITDVKGNIIKVNDVFCEISGYAPMELLGSNHRIINSAYHSPGFFKNMWQTITRGDVWRGEIRNKKKNGNIYWVDTVIVPIIGKDNKPRSFLAIRFDITKKKEYEEQLSGSEKTQRELNNYKNYLIATLSHDIKGPLKSVKGLLKLKNNKALSEEEWKSNSDELISEIQRCENTLDELINWGFINFNKYRSQTSNLSLSEVVRKEVYNQSDQIQNKDLNIEIKNEYEDTVKANHVVISTIVKNLFSNAIKYSPVGKTITIWIGEFNHHACIKFYDEGVGMDNETLKKVLSKERYISEGTEGEKGAGLGLIICRDLIHYIDGMFIAESQPGKGSEIGFTLPK